PVSADPAIPPPTGFMLGKPPDVVAWTGRTPLTVKRSKISMFIRWRATRASSYAGINISGRAHYADEKERGSTGNLSAQGHSVRHEPTDLAPALGARGPDSGTVA